MPNSLHLRDSCIGSALLFWISRYDSAKLGDLMLEVFFMNCFLLIHLDWLTECIDLRVCLSLELVGRIQLQSTLGLESTVHRTELVEM